MASRLRSSKPRRARGLNLVDATCSDVTRTHDLVRELVASGHHVVYIGKRGHPEPAGVLGIAPEHTTLIESIDEADALEVPEDRPLAVTCQTTLSMWDTQAIIERLVGAVSDHRGPQRDLPGDAGAAGGRRPRRR